MDRATNSTYGSNMCSGSSELTHHLQFAVGEDSEDEGLQQPRHGIEVLDRKTNWLDEHRTPRRVARHGRCFCHPLAARISQIRAVDGVSSRRRGAGCGAMSAALSFGFVLQPLYLAHLVFAFANLTRRCGLRRLACDVCTTGDEKWHTPGERRPSSLAVITAQSRNPMSEKMRRN